MPARRIRSWVHLGSIGAAMLASATMAASVAGAIPCAAGAGTDDGCDPPPGSMYGLVLAQAVLPVETVTPQEPPASEPAREPAARRRWVVPPIAWYGRAQYDFRAERFDGGSMSTRHYLTGRLEAKTYVWQPWFARVDGALGVSVGRTRFGTRVEEGQPGDLTDTFLTGGAGIELFPFSRFPFSGRLEVTDNRVDGSGVGLQYRQVRLRLDQRYAPEGRNWSASGTFEHATQSGSFFGRDTQDTLSANWQMALPAHAISVDGSASWNRRGSTGESTLFDTLIGRHTWRIGPGMTLDSTASYVHNQYDLQHGRFENRLAQLSSIGSWFLPDRPWSLTATARATVSDFGGGANSGLALSVGGSYQFNRNWRAYGNLATFASRVPGASTSGAAGSASVTYQTDPVQFGGFDASGFASASAAQAAGSGVDTGFASAQVGYTLGRVWPLGPNLYVNANATQSFGYAATTGTRDSPIVTSNAGVGGSWSGEASQAYLRLSVSDTRATAGDGASSTLANLQFTGNLQFGRYKSLNGDLTLQRSWQRLEAILPADAAQADPLRFFVPQRLGQTTASVNLSYSDQRFLGVPRLRFGSEIRATNDVVNDYNPLAPAADRATRQWITRLDYTIGRLNLGAHVSLYTLDGRRSEAYMVRVQREFGVY